MCACLDYLVRESQIVVEGVQRLPRIEQVSGVAERHLGDRRVGCEDGVDRRTHLLDIVQRVENAEDVYSRPRGLVNESICDARRIRRVADRVPAAKKHLNGDVRQRVSQLFESLPRIFAEEAQSDIVRGSSPGLHGEQLRSQPGDVGGHAEQLLRSHPSGQERLVRVAERGVCHGQRPLSAQLGCELTRSELLQSLSRSGGRFRLQVDRRQLLRGVDARRTGPVRLVHRDVREPVHDLRAAVFGDSTLQQFGPLLNEGRAQVALEESRIVENPLDERDVRRDAANSELCQSSSGACDRSGEVSPATGHLRQH